MTTEGLARDDAFSSRGPFPADAFERLDESDDSEFYRKDRFVQHLDSTALSTVEAIIGQLITEPEPVILDLMAGWDSHIPEKLKPSAVVGLGLNRNELSNNRSLTEILFHDLNRDPVLPFPDDTFDAVINTVSVDYLTRPFEVFGEVARVLKPHGLFLVIFSNRMFPAKAVKLWREATEQERIAIVEEFFKHTPMFEKPQVFVSEGRPRPAEDKYAHLGIPSDPVYAVYAERRGNDSTRFKRPEVRVVFDEDTRLAQEGNAPDKGGHGIPCPHCGQKMKKWAVPVNPFTNWDMEFMFICFNDSCSYYVKGWEVMRKQGNSGTSYRAMYDPVRKTFMPVPVPHSFALRESIVE